MNSSICFFFLIKGLILAEKKLVLEMWNIYYKNNEKIHTDFVQLQPKKPTTIPFQKKTKLHSRDSTPTMQKSSNPSAGFPTPFLNWKETTPQLDPPSQKTPTELKELSPFDILGFSPLENMPSAGEVFYGKFFVGLGGKLKNTYIANRILKGGEKWWFLESSPKASPIFPRNP